MTDDFNENMAQPPQSSQPNCQYTTRYCWEADKVKTLIRLRAELSPLFTGKRNASKYAWAVVERELNVPLPLSKIIKKWNNLLQEYKAIKLSEEPKRREWPFFTLMDVYFSDQVNDPTLRLFSSTKTLKETIDDSVFEDDPIISSAIAAATSGALMDISELVRRQKMKQENDTDSNYGDITPETSLNDYNNANDDNKKSLNISDQQQQREQQQQVQQQHQSIPRRKERATDIQSQQQQHTQQQQQREQQQQLQQQREQQQQQLQREQAVHQQQQHQQQQRQQMPQQSQTPEHHTIDQYLLSWNNFHGNMCRGFHSLQKDEKMVDVTIAAGGKIFKAHKLVLSVCSPYFQKIFLDHPCSHPILFMTDVDSNHMAGLLDFMYSGQVNVKYEDLPNFLKTAEAMRIKGLHSESTIESEADFRTPKPSDDTQTNRFIGNQPHSTVPAHSSIYSNTNGPTTPTGLSNPNSSPARSCQPPIPSPNFLSFRDHIRSKAAINEAFINNAAANNNNNNLPHEKYSIQQTNSSSKILDGRKHHKYFAKRKMLMQYNQDILREKRNREFSENEQQQQQQQQQQSSQVHLPQEQHSPANDNFRIKLPDIRGTSGLGGSGGSGVGSTTSGGGNGSSTGNSVGGTIDIREEALNLQIKKEPCDPDMISHSREDRREEDCSSTTPTDSTVDEEAENEAKAALLKLRHSILEQNLINSNSGTNNNNNNNTTNNNNNNNNYSKNNNNKPSSGDCGNVSLDRNMNAVCS